MKYGIKKLTINKKTVYGVIEPKRDCVEAWMIQAYILGFHKEEEPIKSMADYIEKKYDGVGIHNIYYIEPEKQMFVGPSMPVFTFVKKTEAQKFADELNKKGIELGLS